MAIPLFDCRVGQDEIAAVKAVLASGHLASGQAISHLEASVSARIGGRPTVAVSNLTSALQLALHLAGIGPGDDVLVQSFNCLSSTSAVTAVGARPRWVDIDPETGRLDLEDVRRAKTARTRALVVYHIAGYPADMLAVKALCNELELTLIEDANAAVGGTLAAGIPIGSVGDFAVFSFYANRLVNGIDGAALLCPDDAIAARARRLRRYGIEDSSFRDRLGQINPDADVPEIGLAVTMANVNAVLAQTHLASLDTRLDVIRENVRTVHDAIAGQDFIGAVPALPGSKPAYWACLLLSQNRDAILEQLVTAGIGCSKLHHPNHLYSGFSSEARALPGTMAFAATMLAIPCGAWVNETQRSIMIETLLGAK